MVLLILYTFYASLKHLLLNTIKIPNPVEMATSATLKTALKKVKGFPPITGTHSGIGMSLIIGKYNISTTSP